MRYLLDTNVLIYMLCASDELSDDARRIIQTEQEVSISVASLWEIAIKQSIGKLDITLSIPEIEGQCIARDISIAPLTAAAIERIKTLPDIHRDPFDRILIAHAIEGAFALVTSDRTIPQYPVDVVW